MRQLILASTSPYRSEALGKLGLSFQSAKPHVDERPLTGEHPDALALRLAHAKAEAVAKRYADAVIIGADQVGHCDGRLLGKPDSAADATQQLCRVSGRSATFYSAVVVHDTRTAQRSEEVVTTRLAFRNFNPEEAAFYVSADQPLDCAGAFKAEALGIALFRSISSDDPSALIGLPMISLIDQLEQCGINPLQSV